MHYLRQSTASQEVPLGYFVDSTDGNTEETGLTIANTDIKVWKTGTTTLANKNSGGATHISNGIYYAVLDATDTDTIGPLTLFVHVSGALAVRVPCCVLDEAVYDVWFGTTAPATTGNLGSSTVGTVTTLTNDPTGVGTLLTRLGTPSNLGGGATVAANLADIESQTDDIGAAGAGLTAADDAILAAIAALNNLSAAQVWANGTRTLTSLSGLTVDTVTSVTNNVNAQLANGVAHGGSTATLRLGVAGAGPALHVTSGSGNAVTITSSSGNGVLVFGGTNGIDLSGTFGAGLSLTGGGGQDISLSNSASSSLRDAVWTGGTRTLTSLDEDTTTIDLDATLAAGVPSAAAIAAAVLAAGDVDGFTMEQTLKLCLAALAGKLSGAATTTVTIRAADDSKNRLTATVDADGNRSAVTLDAAG